MCLSNRKCDLQSRIQFLGDTRIRPFQLRSLAPLGELGVMACNVHNTQRWVIRNLVTRTRRPQRLQVHVTLHHHNRFGHHLHESNQPRCRFQVRFHQLVRKVRGHTVTLTQELRCRPLCLFDDIQHRGRRRRHRGEFGRYAVQLSSRRRQHCKEGCRPCPRVTCLLQVVATYLAR